MKYSSIKREFDKQKHFYEMALEERFKQMESFEEECTQLRLRTHELEQREGDNRIKYEMAAKDKDDLKRKMDHFDRENL